DPATCFDTVDVIGGGGRSTGASGGGGGAVGLAAILAAIFGDDIPPVPNVGGNLTDGGKAEMGGAGSGTPGGWGPQDEENARWQEAAAKRTNEVSELFDYNNPRSGVQIGERTLIEMPNSGKAKIFSGASEVEVQQYFMELIGSKQMPVARDVPGRGIVYSVRTPQGTFNLRNFSNSVDETGKAWTIDIPRGVAKPNAPVEIKFLQ
ncbi:hypothetical protein, partial [Limnobaculum xujianqingii]|uniref:hypothetical protein n=1 Tax=Limnobaculum xujianqingii TaxID=2738837 RepID=UPI001F35255A